jgi:uncharacterized protein YbaP (TraB family)
MASSYLVTFQALQTPSLFEGPRSLESPLLKIKQLENGQRVLSLTTRKKLGFLGRIWTWLGFGNASSRKIVAFLNSEEGYRQLSNLSSEQCAEISSKMIQLNRKFRSKLNDRILNIFLTNTTPNGECRAPAYFWKIENEKGEATYLLGTYHTLPFKIVHPLAKQAFANSQHVALESVYDPQLIRQSFDKETWRKFKEMVRADERNAFKNLSSKALKTLSGRQLCKLLTHYSPPRMDEDIEEKARKKNKTLYQLDDPNRKIFKYTASYPKSDLLKAMENPTKWVETGKKTDEFLRVKNEESAYAEEKAIENVFKERFHNPEEERETSKRNLYWMPLIESLIAKGNAFVAVGLAHFDDEFCGPSVLSLLKQKGYKITKVTPNSV